MWKEDASLREMAIVLLVDALASSQENGDSEVLAGIGDLMASGCDLCDTVPAELKKHGVTLNAGIEMLLPEMAKLVKAINAKWAGRLTLAEVASEFGENVYTTCALSAMGHGVSLSDDTEIVDFISGRGCNVIHDLYIASDRVYEAAYLIEEELSNKLEAV